MQLNLRRLFKFAYTFHLHTFFSHRISIILSRQFKLKFKRNFNVIYLLFSLNSFFSMQTKGKENEKKKQ